MGKIVFFIPSFNVGGVEKVMILLANRIFDCGWKVVFLVTCDHGDLKPLLNKNIEIVNLGNIRLRKALFPLIHFLKSEQPDFLICGPNFVNLISLTANWLIGERVKIIVTQHSYFDVEAKRLGAHARLLPLFIKLLYPRAFRIIGVSEGIKKMLIDWKLPLSKIVRIYNPIDINSIKTMALEEVNLKIPKDFIVYVGRLEYVKNMPLLLRAYAIFRKRRPETYLVIVGDGSDKNILTELVKMYDLTDWVIFCGNLLNPFPLIAKSRLLALSSFSESFGNVIVEAMALGITSVATSTQGVKEISEGGRYVYLADDFDDESHFADLMEHAYSFPFNQTDLYERACQFRLEKIAEKYMDLIGN